MMNIHTLGISREQTTPQEDSKRKNRLNPKNSKSNYQ